MKSLAILDTADLDRAIGGVNRSMPSARNFDIGQLGGHIGQLANDFGFAIPNDVRQTIDQVAVTMQGIGGDCGADMADEQAPPVEEPVEMWCGTPGDEAAPPVDEPADPIAVEAHDGKWDDIDLANAPVLISEPMAADTIDAGSAPGGVIVSGGAVSAAGNVAESASTTALFDDGNFSAHGFFDDAHAIADEIGPATEARPSVDASAPGGIIVQSEAAGAPTTSQLAEAQPSSGFQGLVRDHRGR